MVANFKPDQDPHTCTILVTPEMAKSWLGMSRDYQRSISQKTVKEYASLMQKKQWRVTPTHSVGIATDGSVVDGQHRLQAVVQYGQPVLMSVVFNVDPDIFGVIDRGRPRSLAQIAAMSNKEYHSFHVHAVNTLLWTPEVASSVVNTWDGSEIADVLSFFQKEVQAAFPKECSSSKQFRQASLRGAALRAAISRPSEIERVTRFVTIMATGLPLDSGDEAVLPLMLRNVAISLGSRSADRNTRFRLYRSGLLALKHFLEGKVITQSNLAYSKFQRQPFPIPLDDKPSSQSFEEWARTRS